MLLVAGKRLARGASGIGARELRRQRPAPAAAAAFLAPRRVADRQQSTAALPAPLSPPPFPTVIIYNQSKHATQSVLADIRAVWGNKVRVLQTLEDGTQPVPGIDGAIFVKPKSWGNMHHFGERLWWLCTQDHRLHQERDSGSIVFMPGWSAFAESAEAARAVQDLGLVWPGTKPRACRALDKIGFKRTCERMGAPTPPFVVLSEEDAGVDLTDLKAMEQCVKDFMARVATMDSKEKGLIKSVHGRGGKGTAHLDDPSDPAQVRAAIEKVLVEMHRSDGIYYEQKVNTDGDGRFYQLELEVDGETCSHGGRFVWFNSRLQKVVEVGLADDLVGMFMPPELYAKARAHAEAIARGAGNNTRATMEALVFQKATGEFELDFIECDCRPQVENEALALLEQDSFGNRRYTFAELMMRAKGVPAPAFTRSASCSVVLHARWLHGNPDADGNISYQAGSVSGMSGPRLDFVPAELMAPGDIAFSSDPQLGKAVITASSWEEMCDRAALYFKLRQPIIAGNSSTYAQTMQNLFSSAEFRAGKVASNETFKKLEIPFYPARNIISVLQDQVSPLLVNGYRPNQGIDPDRWPTPRISVAFQELSEQLAQELPRPTEFTKFARGEALYADYVCALRDQLSDQGGGWVTVAPRDTVQQGNDSESAAITAISRRNAEVWGERAGCVGYEIGGAQYQAGLVRGFDPATVLLQGLPFNMPGHSLQRSQYVNGLSALPESVRLPLFHVTAELVAGHYRPLTGVGGKMVPWLPYNFHPGNFIDEATGYSAQDETTTELLKAGCVPVPTWVFSAKFPLDTLAKWTQRQIDLFSRAGSPLQQIRIKNPGQGLDWTADAVWAHVQTIASVFRAMNMENPIIYLHSHNFNGLSSHVGADLLRRAQSEGFDSLVVDAAARKNGTHNDNTVLTAALLLSADQKEALLEYNHGQQAIEDVLCRFCSRDSQMTPWDSDWAGGTEGSDIRIAKEYGINVRQINQAKELASELFPLERSVTPFSEYKLRLGIAIMIENGIEPKTADAVRKWLENGGKLRVGGDVLTGLKRWETLVPKTPEVERLLENMPMELKAAELARARVITSDDLPRGFTTAQRFTALGFQRLGMDFATSQAKGTDLTPLLAAPHVLHAKPRSLEPGTRFEVLLDPSDCSKRAYVEFKGFGVAPNKDIVLSYLHEGQTVQVQIPDPDIVVAVADSGPRKAEPGNPLHLPCVVPGELLSYSVGVGDILKAGQPLCVLESMKMEMKIAVPDALEGLEVRSLPCRGRTKDKQGDILSPGDLLLELKKPPR